MQRAARAAPAASGGPVLLRGSTGCCLRAGCRAGDCAATGRRRCGGATASAEAVICQLASLFHGRPLGVAFGVYGVATSTVARRSWSCASGISTPWRIHQTNKWKRSSSRGVCGGGPPPSTTSFARRTSSSGNDWIRDRNSFGLTMPCLGVYRDTGRPSRLRVGSNPPTSGHLSRPSCGTGPARGDRRPRSQVHGVWVRANPCRGTPA